MHTREQGDVPLADSDRLLSVLVAEFGEFFAHLVTLVVLLLFFCLRCVVLVMATVTPEGWAVLRVTVKLEMEICTVGE